MPRNRSSVTVQGMDELARRLQQLPDTIQDGVRAAVKAETDEVADDMRRNAPRDSGKLADSIQAEVNADGLGGRAAATIRYATFVEHGTSTTPAQPFAMPAAERARGRFPDRVRDEVGEELGRLIR